MKIITQIQRYLSHDLNTKYHSVKLYRSSYSVSFVCRRYKISKMSLMRWNKKYDGTKESLVNKTHKPLTPHPNAYTNLELYWISNYPRRCPNITLNEL